MAFVSVARQRSARRLRLPAILSRPQFSHKRTPMLDVSLMFVAMSLGILLLGGGQHGLHWPTHLSFG